jgi:hypothetical protein
MSGRIATLASSRNITRIGQLSRAENAQID